MPCRAGDSTGIKAEGEGEWHARKHGGAKRRLWRKIHIHCPAGECMHSPRGASTNRHWRSVPSTARQVICLANRPRGEITGSHIGDAPMLCELLDQIPADVEIGSVEADGAYDTRRCHDAVADRGADAVIPPRKNADASSYLWEIAVQYGTLSPKLKFRNKAGATWDAWQTIVATDNILGPVSQAGGGATGAIIERGSNANGDYARFADGTQICTRSGLVAARVDADHCAVAWTFPAAYAAPPDAVTLTLYGGT